MTWGDMSVMRALFTVAGLGRTEWEGPAVSSGNLVTSWSGATPDDPESDEANLDHE